MGHLFTNRLLLGLIAGIGLSLAGFVARLGGFAPFPAEKIYNTVTFWLGTPEVFQLVHKVFGFGQAGKIAAFGAVLLAWLGGLTLLGLLPNLAASVVLGLVSTLALSTAGGLAIVWGVLYALLYFAIRRSLEPLANDPERRAALRWLGLGAAGVLGAGAYGLLRPLFVGGPEVAAQAGAAAGPKPPSAITPTKDFYYVSISNEALDPQIKEGDWRLEVGGLVKTPSRFSLSELRSGFKAEEFEWTLACISNPVGGDLAGNALWRGFKFKDLMQKVGVQPGAKWVLWEAADGFYESIPLKDVLEEDCHLVYDMNGAALNTKHGFPLRVLIPGRYGMKMPRWITKITLASEDKPGYWVNRGWSKTAFIQPTSRFDYPKDGDQLKVGSNTTLAGVAFAGGKAITKVEVSADDGQNWLEARLQTRSKYAWTLWTLPWVPVANTTRLLVRCHADGVVQSNEDRDSLPEAASGYHSIVIGVV